MLTVGLFYAEDVFVLFVRCRVWLLFLLSGEVIISFESLWGGLKGKLSCRLLSYSILGYFIFTPHCLASLTSWI